MVDKDEARGSNVGQLAVPRRWHLRAGPPRNEEGRGICDLSEHAFTTYVHGLKLAS